MAEAARPHRVNSPSYLADGTPVAAGGDTNFVVIGSDEDKAAYPEVYVDEDEAREAFVQASSEQAAAREQAEREAAHAAEAPAPRPRSAAAKTETAAK